MVERNLGRVIRDDPSGAERCRISVKTPEVVEPELRVEAAGIVFDERELDPPHRPVEPAGAAVAGGGRALFDAGGSFVRRRESERSESARPRRRLEELSPADSVAHGVTSCARPPALSITLDGRRDTDA